MLCLAAGIAAASCVKENFEPVQTPDAQLTPMTFSAEAEPGVRTSLGADYSVVWSDRDSISVFSNDSHTPFALTEKSADGKTASFAGLAETASTYYAVYPYSWTNAMGKDGVITSIPAEQTAVAGGFAAGANVSIAVSSDNSFLFRNVGALVGITVGNDNIRNIVLTAEGDMLAGTSEISLEGGIPTARISEGSYSVRLAGEFVKGQKYYFVVYPGNYTSFELTYIDADGKIASLKNEADCELERNGNIDLQTITMSNFEGFEAGDDLFIGGEGAEEGQKFLYVTEGYYTRNNDSYANKYQYIEEGDNGYYEMYTYLEAGKPYYFYTGSKTSQKLLFKGSALEAVLSKELAAATVSTSSTYRVRVNPRNNKVSLLQVSGIVLRREYDSKLYEMEYVGNGTWTIEDFHAVTLNYWGGENRYRFIIQVIDKDGVANTQGLSQNFTNITGDYPTRETDARYWYLEPSYTGQYKNTWKYPAYVVDNSDFEKYHCDVNLYLNADVDHYTHEFVNEWAWGETEEWLEGYDLFIGGEGAEAGQKFTYIEPATYYNTSRNFADNLGRIEGNHYEIFTRIEAGKPFYFYSSSSAKNWYFKADGFKEASSAEEASIVVSETAVYRVRINPESGEISYVKVNKVVFDNPWGNDKDVELPYAGKGIWKASNANIKMQVVNWGHARCDNRYKFYMELDGLNGRQGLGGVEGANGFYIQPTNGGDWDEKLFGLPAEVVDQNNEDRYSADIILYMNDDKGHYTHEFANIVDNEPIVQDFELFMAGAGSEAGQKFRFITSNEDVYNTNTGDPQNYGDLEQKIDGPYYEIFTKLTAGQPYYFVTDNNVIYSASDFSVKENSESASATVDADNVYRIRIDVTNKTVYKKIVKKIEVFVSQTQGHTTMTYSSKGTWNIPGYTVTWGTASWGVEERYRFKLTFGDDTVQPYGLSNNLTGNRPTESTDLKYWEVQPCQKGQWTGCFKFPTWLFDQNNNSRYKADIALNLNVENAERPYYYHEFSNTVDTLAQ